MNVGSRIWVGAGVVALGALGYWFVPFGTASVARRAAASNAPAAQQSRPTEEASLSEHRAELFRLRRSDEDGALDDFVAAQTERAAETGDDAAPWRLLAEAHLERCVHRDRRRGMEVGEPIYDALPPGHAEDIDAGLAAADRAIELGDPTGDAWRIRSGLLSLRITGFGSYLEHRPPAKEALAKAEEIDPANPRVVQANAMEALLAPTWLGGDPARAAELLQRVATALPFDERPLVSLAFARFRLDDRAGTRDALDRALAANPENAYARGVRARLDAGEAEPFAADVVD